MMLFVTMLLLLSCESAGENDDQGCRHAETTIKAAYQDHDDDAASCEWAGVAARGSRLHAETTIKTSMTTTTTVAAGHVAGASGARAASSEPSLTINKQHARATFRITLLPRPGVYAGKS
eukprot:CAMPEP_0179924178 /NCGR_PEP_ID=MMETSP0983-20121128/6574_1 /TAXON_ID=483367 /ORGANISM="non described non described, Strain CCMP 2436" /LENGTH=119 /DNA_ID=CAMNT_0021827655 /DNA_START=85 /DNA_END=442 /DNA_ORIENTATION=-